MSERSEELSEKPRDYSVKVKEFVPDTPHQFSGMSAGSRSSSENSLNSAWRQARRTEGSSWWKQHPVSPVAFLEWEASDRSTSSKENAFTEWEDTDLSEFSGKVAGVAACVSGFETMTAGNLDQDERNSSKADLENLDPVARQRLHAEACGRVLEFPVVQKMIEAQLRALAGSEAVLHAQDDRSGNDEQLRHGNGCDMHRHVFEETAALRNQLGERGKGVESREGSRSNFMPEKLSDRPSMQRLPCPEVRRSSGSAVRTQWPMGNSMSAFDLLATRGGLRDKVKINEFSGGRGFPCPE